MGYPICALKGCLGHIPRSIATSVVDKGRSPSARGLTSGMSGEQDGAAGKEGVAAWPKETTVERQGRCAGRRGFNIPKG